MHARRQTARRHSCRPPTEPHGSVQRFSSLQRQHFIIYQGIFKIDEFKRVRLTEMTEMQNRLLVTLQSFGPQFEMCVSVSVSYGYYMSIHTQFRIIILYCCVSIQCLTITICRLIEKKLSTDKLFVMFKLKCHTFAGFQLLKKVQHVRIGQLANVYYDNKYELTLPELEA